MSMLPHWSVEFYGHRSPCFSAPNMWMMTQNCRKPHQPRVIFPGHVRSPLVSQLVQLFKWEKLRKNIFGTWYRPWWLPSGNWTVRVFQMAIVKSLIYPWRNVIFHRFLLVYQRVIDFPNPLFFLALRSGGCWWTLSYTRRRGSLVSYSPWQL